MTKLSRQYRFIDGSPFLLCTCILLFISQARCFDAQRNMAASRQSYMPLKAASHRIVVAVTREDGKNEKLLKKMKDDSAISDQLELLELPCIEHASGPDIDILASTLTSKKWDYVAVTSPEAAKVVASAWDVVRDDPIPVVAVGAATEKALRGYSIDVCFTPSKATAETLAAELELKGPGTSLLYPASARAKETLKNGLEARGFEVTRLNTYDTVTARWSDEQKEAAKQVKVACFASPSSIKGWLQNTDENKDVIAACIGETSAKACRRHNWDESRIFFPEKPGLDGWVQAIKEAADSIKVSHA
jgi:uroporphyrinogen-III synthase